jgi:hypothetical protein
MLLDHYTEVVIMQDVVDLNSGFHILEFEDFRAADLSQVQNVPIETNGDEDHMYDKAIVKFQKEFHTLADVKTYAIQCLLHLVAHRPRLLNALRSHRFDKDSLQHVDLSGPNALKQVRAIRVADLLLARAAHATT